MKTRNLSFSKITNPHLYPSYPQTPIQRRLNYSLIHNKSHHIINNKPSANLSSTPSYTKLNHKNSNSSLVSHINRDKLARSQNYYQKPINKYQRNLIKNPDCISTHSISIDSSMRTEMS